MYLPHQERTHRIRIERQQGMRMLARENGVGFLGGCGWRGGDTEGCAEGGGSLTGACEGLAVGYGERRFREWMKTKIE